MSPSPSGHLQLQPMTQVLSVCGSFFRLGPGEGNEETYPTTGKGNSSSQLSENLGYLRFLGGSFWGGVRNDWTQENLEDLSIRNMFAILRYLGSLILNHSHVLFMIHIFMIPTSTLSNLPSTHVPGLGGFDP